MNSDNPSIVTLLTDFGAADTYVGVMKGVILSIAPKARLVDLTHEIGPRNVLEASVRLEGAAPYFPAGTIHLAVVDPGVGSERDALVVQTERFLFVAPDNGILTHVLRSASVRRITRLKEAARRYFLPIVSATFHGRDVFAPIAGHLASGLPPAALDDGGPETPPASLPLLQPELTMQESGARACYLHVLWADRFGNLITDMSREFWTAWVPEHMHGAEADCVIQIGDTIWQGIRRTYADAPPGSPLAYWGSGGYLEIAMRNGSAAATFGIAPGAPIMLRL